MTAADDRRQTLTNLMADFVLAHGLGAASLRPLAAAAGVSDRMLLYYFTDKAQALTAAFDCLLARLADALRVRVQPAPLPIGRLRGKVTAVLLDDALWPHMQLWLDVTSLAARGDAVQRARGQQIAAAIHGWLQGQLVSDDTNQQARLMMMIQAAIWQKALGLRDISPD